MFYVLNTLLGNAHIIECTQKLIPKRDVLFQLSAPSGTTDPDTVLMENEIIFHTYMY